MKIHVQGSNPQLCLIAGTHGDEYSVIASVEKAIQRYADQLPDFVWIPEVSPSAVARKTRENVDGIDVNRHFQETTPDQEAREVMQALKDFHFQQVINFHEDTELEGFYCYDTGTEPPLGWDAFCVELAQQGVPLMNGIDDPTDPVLGYRFKNGYCSYQPRNDGSLESWLYMNGIAKRVLTTEIPRALSQPAKDSAIDALFSRLLINVQ